MFMTTRQDAMLAWPSPQSCITWQDDEMALWGVVESVRWRDGPADSVLWCRVEGWGERVSRVRSLCRSFLLLLGLILAMSPLL